MRRACVRVSAAAGFSSESALRVLLTVTVPDIPCLVCARVLLNSVSLSVNAILELWPYMGCRWKQKVEGASSVWLLENKIR